MVDSGGESGRYYVWAFCVRCLLELYVRGLDTIGIRSGSTRARRPSAGRAGGRAAPAPTAHADRDVSSQVFPPRHSLCWPSRGIIESRSLQPTSSDGPADLPRTAHTHAKHTLRSRALTQSASCTRQGRHSNVSPFCADLQSADPRVSGQASLASGLARLRPRPWRHGCRLGWGRRRLTAPRPRRKGGGLPGASSRCPPL